MYFCFIPALRYTSGKYVVNGGWAVDWAGDYQAGGTTFKYLRPSKHGRHHGEQLLAVGPTNASMDMMVSNGGHQPLSQQEWGF